MEPYNNNESNIDPNEALGQRVFLYMYIANAVIAYVLGYFLYQLLLEVYDSEVGRDKDFPFPPQFITVTFLASVYLIIPSFVDMVYYCYNWNNLNVFIGLKMMVMTIPVIVFVFFITVKYMYNTKEPYLGQLSSLITNFRSISRKLLVGLLTLAIVFLILNVFPTLLLFFAHPLNTFTLLVFHIALFYTETITGMLVIKQCCKCEHNQGSSTEQPKRSNKLPSMAHNRQESKGGEIKYNSTCNILCRLVLAIGVVIIICFVYIIVMWFYQILFLRSLINNLAFDYFIKYIPNVVIAVFGYMYLIQKGTFSNKEKENQEHPKSD